MIDLATAELVAELTPEEFARWRHEPAGRAFDAYLRAQLELWRENAADLVLIGAFRSDAPNPERNSLYVGGKMRALDDLLRITLSDIQGFYREATAGEEASGDSRTDTRQGT